MITARPTEHLTGIIIEGEYEDFDELVDGIYRMTGLVEDYGDLYWSVKNRLLGLCYDIRHAYQGDRNVKLVDNGVFDEMMKWHSMIMPKQNVHFSVEVLFPEALFIAFAVPEIYSYSSIYYGENARRLQEREEHPRKFADRYAEYCKDKALIDLLISAIYSAFADVVGDEEFEKLIRSKERKYGREYQNYATQYVDKCNIDYLKTAPEKRKDKLKNIAKRLIRKPDAYDRMLSDLKYSASQYGCSIHELHDPKLKYPENVEW